MLRTRVYIGRYKYSNSTRRILLSQQRLLSFNALKNAPFVDIHPEVEAALAAEKPVVALETAIVTHGMPYPTNLETALSMESIVRSTGSIPATIGLIGGRVKIGLTPNELEHLATARGNADVAKISRRDIGPAIATKKDGGTTCAGTLLFAALAGIKVFSTGGLGGVHRGGENSMDVSADLYELTRSRVGLVSAGVKSILDIGRTLEYLETLGVPVLSYAKTKDFPNFFSPRSGFKSAWNSDDPKEVAALLYSQWQLGMTNGALIAAPIPEQYEASGAEIQESVEQAIRESEENGIAKQGKDATPWLLNRIAELTQGKSVKNNIALVENTALIGGKIAVEYSRLAAQIKENGDNAHKQIYSAPENTPKITNAVSETPTAPLTPAPLPKAVVIGGIAADISSQPSYGDSNAHTTVPGSVAMSLGGVGRNIAEACHRIVSQEQDSATDTLLLSPVGSDGFGLFLQDKTRELGMRTDGLLEMKGHRSAVCNLILDHSGNLVTGVADMGIIRAFDAEKVINSLRQWDPKIMAVDGNLSPETLETIVTDCHAKGIPVFFEPTAVPKSTSIFPAITAVLQTPPGSRTNHRAPIALASPNLLELDEMYLYSRTDAFTSVVEDEWWKVMDALNIRGSSFEFDVKKLSRLPVSSSDASLGTLSFILERGISQKALWLLPFFEHLVIKCGSLGVVSVMRIPSHILPQSSWANERTDFSRRTIVTHGSEGVVLQHFPPEAVPQNTIVNTTGAGDSLVGSLLASFIQDEHVFESTKTMLAAMTDAQRTAVLSLQSGMAISPMISSMPRSFKGFS